MFEITSLGRVYNGSLEVIAEQTIQIVSRVYSVYRLTNQQDWELSNRAQAGISSKGYQPGPYSNREELLLALDRFVLERVEGQRD